MNVLLAFIGGVIVGLIAYLIAGAIPFLAAYAGLIGLLMFLVAGYSIYTGNARL